MKPTIELFHTKIERDDSVRPIKSMSYNCPGHRDRLNAHCAQVKREYLDSGRGQNDIKTSNITKADIIHIRAFRAAYKLLYHLPAAERLLVAICQTSDDMFRKTADKAKIKQWELEYG